MNQPSNYQIYEPEMSVWREISPNNTTSSGQAPQISSNISREIMSRFRRTKATPINIKNKENIHLKNVYIFPPTYDLIIAA